MCARGQCRRHSSHSLRVVSICTHIAVYRVITYRPHRVLPLWRSLMHTDESTRDSETGSQSQSHSARTHTSLAQSNRLADMRARHSKWVKQRTLGYADSESYSRLAGSRAPYPQLEPKSEREKSLSSRGGAEWRWGGGDAWVGRTPLQAGGGEHAADAKEVVRRAHGPTFTGDRQLLHTNEPTCAPASRARARVAAAAAEGGAEQGDL